MEKKLGKKIVVGLMALVLVQAPGLSFAHKSNNERLDAIDARMQRVERITNNQALINMSQRIDALQREIQQLRGENEQLTHELNTLKERQRDQFLNIDRRLQGSSTATMTEDPNVATTSNVTSSDSVVINNDSINQSIDTTNTSDQKIATTSGTIVSNKTSNDAAQDYKNAFTLLKQGKYDESIVAFNGFLQVHSSSKYASNAQYWLAEANYVSKRYPQALTEFTKVVEKYPASSKVADARLKLGFTHYELGQYEESRVELTRLRAQFPNSSVASLAQQRLERMAREGH